MADMIYALEGLDVQVYPDVSVITPMQGDDRSGRFALVPADPDRVLFPEVGNSLETAREFARELNEAGIQAGGDPSFVPDIQRFARFGIKPEASDGLQEILNRYCAMHREMIAQQKKFFPGVQYNFRGFSDDGVEVIFGNYGLFGATMLAASRDPAYKQFLIDEGIGVYGARDAFITNPPAVNAVITTEDGFILFAKRGPTAEYAYMLHQVAAGHHNPEKAIQISDLGRTYVALSDLVAQQVQAELNVGREHIRDFKLNGLALSTGYKVIGTEKAEVLTSATLDLSVDDVFGCFDAADHKWEHRTIFAARPGAQTGAVIQGTFDAHEAVHGLSDLVQYGSKDISLGKDPSNAYGYWVPVGAGGLIAFLGSEADGYFPQSWNRGR